MKCYFIIHFQNILFILFYYIHVLLFHNDIFYNNTFISFTLHVVTTSSPFSQSCTFCLTSQRAQQLPPIVISSLLIGNATSHSEYKNSSRLTLMNQCHWSADTSARTGSTLLSYHGEDLKAQLGRGKCPVWGPYDCFSAFCR